MGGTDREESTLLRWSRNVTVSDGDVGRVFCRPEGVAEFHDNGRVEDVGDVDEPGDEGSRDIEGKVMEGKEDVASIYHLEPWEDCPCTTYQRKPVTYLHR